MKPSTRGIAQLATALVPVLLLVVALAPLGNCATFDPKYREIVAQFDIGVVPPPSDRRNAMDTGTTFGGQLGVALSPRITSGFFLDYQVFGSKQSTVPPAGAYVGGNNWTRYSGGAFGEVLLTRTQLAPFIGGYVGVHAIHIWYARNWNGFTDQGTYGLGFGGALGLRYRVTQRFGTTVRFQADKSHYIDSGWFLQGRLGLTAFY